MRLYHYSRCVLEKREDLFFSKPAGGVLYFSSQYCWTLFEFWNSFMMATLFVHDIFEEQTTSSIVCIANISILKLDPVLSSYRLKSSSTLNNHTQFSVNNISNILRGRRDRVVTPTTSLIVSACIPLWNITLFLPVAEDGGAAGVTLPEAGVVAFDRSGSGELGENLRRGSVDNLSSGGVEGCVQCIWAGLSTTDWLPPEITPIFPVGAVALDRFDVDNGGVGEVGGVSVVDSNVFSSRVDGSGS